MTKKLNAFPKGEQTKIFCQAMGFSVIDYLTQKSVYNGEVENEIEWLEI